MRDGEVESVIGNQSVRWFFSIPEIMGFGGGGENAFIFFVEIPFVHLFDFLSYDVCVEGYEIPFVGILMNLFLLSFFYHVHVCTILMFILLAGFDHEVMVHIMKMMMDTCMKGKTTTQKKPYFCNIAVYLFVE